MLNFGLIILPDEPAKDLRHVGVVSSRLGDGNAQLGVAHGTQHADPASTHPHDERQSHGAGMLQDAFGGHEDARANNIAWGQERERGMLAQTTTKILTDT